MTSRKSKDQGKMKYTLVGKPSKSRKSSSQEQMMSSIPSENNSMENSIDLMELDKNSPEQYYIQTLKQEITRLRKKLDDVLDNNGEILRAKATHIEDKINLQKALAENENQIQAMKTQYISSMQSLKNEVNAKTDLLQELEESMQVEKEKYKELKEQLLNTESKLTENETVILTQKTEISNHLIELSSLKSQITNLTDKSQSSEEKLVRTSQTFDSWKLEKKSYQDKIIQLERKIQEFVEREGFLTNDSVRIATTLSQQNENYEQLNEIITQMKINMNGLKEQRDSENSRANITEHRLMEIMKTFNELQQRKIELEQKLGNVEKQNIVLIAELKKCQSTIESIRDGRAMLTTKVEMLEKEKVTLLLEQIAHSKQIDALKQNLEESEMDRSLLGSKLEEEIQSKQTILASNLYKDSDLQKIKDDNIELQQNLESIRKELKDMEQIKIEFQEMYRSQQQENVARISEYSQKNAQMSEEILSLKEQIINLNTIKTNDLLVWDTERSELKSQIVMSRQKILDQVDHIEELNAKLESSKGEIDELKDKLKQSTMTYEQKIQADRNQSIIDSEQIRLQVKEEYESVIHNMKESYQKTIEEKYRNLMIATKENHEKRHSQLQTKIQDLVVELSACKISLNNAEITITKETEKYSVVTQQLKDLRKYSEENSSKLQDQIKSLEKDKINVISKYKAEIEDLNEQITSLHDAVSRKDQNIELFRQQINAEKEQRFQLSQRMLELEDYQSKTKYNERAENQRYQTIQDQLHSWEVKYDNLKQEKDVELSRLQKRNDLLSETVARLTSITKDTATSNLNHNSSSSNNNGNIANNTMISSTPRSQTNQSITSHTKNLTIKVSEDMKSTTNVLSSSSSSQVDYKISPVPTKSSSNSVVKIGYDDKNNSNNINKDNISNSNINSNSNLSNSSISPNHRAMMTEQVNSAIHKVQEAIDRRKIKMFENEISNQKTSNGDEKMIVTDTIKIMRADLESTPRNKQYIVTSSPPLSPSNRSGQDMTSSYSEKLRQTVKSSQDFLNISPKSNPSPGVETKMDLIEEY